MGNYDYSTTTDAVASSADEQRRRRYAKEYFQTNKLEKDTKQRREQLREMILGMVQNEGTADEVGNKWLPAIDHMIKAERRVSTSFDAAKAEQWLRDNGWWDDAKVTVPERVIPAHDVIDEDSLNLFLFQKKDDKGVPSEIPDDLYNVKETFALKVTEEEQYDF